MSIIQEGLEILYTEREDVIKDFVEYTWRLVQDYGVKEVNEFFNSLEVSRVKEDFMLALVLRNFYAHNNHIHSWLDIYNAVEQELNKRGEDSKRMLRGNLKEPYKNEFNFTLGPIIKI